MSRVRDWWLFALWFVVPFIAGTAEAVVAYKTGLHWFPHWVEIVYSFVALAVGGLATLVALSWLHQAVDDWQAGRRARVTK